MCPVAQQGEKEEGVSLDIGNLVSSSQAPAPGVISNVTFLM